MTPTNQPQKRKPSSNRNLKLFLTALSVTTTLSGWALIALNQPKSTDAAASDASEALQPTVLPSPTQAPLPSAPVAEAPQVVIPPLSSLPVRGLRDVGDPGAAPAAPQLVFAPPAAPASGGGGGHNNGGGGSGGGGPAVQQPAPQPPPPPPPKPPAGGHTHGSHP